MQAGGCHRLHATASVLATLGKALAAAEPRFERSQPAKIVVTVVVVDTLFDIHSFSDQRPR